MSDGIKEYPRIKCWSCEKVFTTNLTDEHLVEDGRRLTRLLPCLYCSERNRINVTGLPGQVILRGDNKLDLAEILAQKPGCLGELCLPGEPSQDD